MRPLDLMQGSRAADRCFSRTASSEDQRNGRTNGNNWPYGQVAASGQRDCYFHVDDISLEK